MTDASKDPKYPFKQRNLKSDEEKIEEKIHHLQGLEDKITKRIRKLENAKLDAQRDPTLEDQYENQIEDLNIQLAQNKEKLEAACIEKNTLENNKTNQENYSLTDSENEENKTSPDSSSSEFDALIEISKKPKESYDNSKVEEVNTTNETVQAKLLFKNDEPIKNTVLYTATFFPQLSSHEFEIVVSFLLEYQPPIIITESSEILINTNEVKKIETKVQKSLIEIWKDSLNQPDNNFLNKCYLTAVRLDDGSQVIDFSLPYLRQELKDYLEKQPIYVGNQFKRVQLLLFSPSVKIASSVIELTVQMAVSHPQIYRDNWLLAIILEFTEEANWEIDETIDIEKNIQNLLAELEAEQKREIVFARISFLIYEMLEHPQLKEATDKFIERLIAAQRYDAVIVIIKHLYDVPEFNRLYWVKQLLDRGNGQTRSDAYKLIYNWLKQSGSQIYNFLESIKTWLPDSNRSSDNYSYANEYALQLLIEYCLETTKKFDEKYYGYWPSKYQLLTYLQDSEVDHKLEILISWLFHPDDQGGLALKHLVDKNIDPIQIIAGLIAEWFTILYGLEKKEPNPEAYALGNKILQQVILVTNLSQQKDLIQAWFQITDDLLTASEYYRQANNSKQMKQLIQKRALVKQLKKDFKFLQINN
jgi:hypothetical protein